jgi:hypothetical protein
MSLRAIILPPIFAPFPFRDKDAKSLLLDLSALIYGVIIVNLVVYEFCQYNGMQVFILRRICFIIGPWQGHILFSI